MCLGVPGRIVEVNGLVATVDFWGIRREVRLELRVLDARADEAERGVELVHLAVGVDARVALLDARPPEEARFPAIARLRVDLHAAVAYHARGAE